MDIKLVNQLLEAKLFETDKQREYSCVMTDKPEASVATDILRYSLSIPDADLYDSEPGYGRELDVHSTVKYGIETEDATVVQKLIDESDAQPFQIVLGKISLFSKDDKPYDVVKIEVHSPGIEKLHKLLSTLPNGDENPKYVPHMTLAYVKKGKGDKYEGDKTFVGTEFGVDTLVFSDYTGNKTKITLPSNEDVK